MFAVSAVSINSCGDDIPLFTIAWLVSGGVLLRLLQKFPVMLLQHNTPLYSKLAADQDTTGTR
jgi:hypothetical protein